MKRLSFITQIYWEKRTLFINPIRDYVEESFLYAVPAALFIVTIPIQIVALSILSSSDTGMKILERVLGP